MLGRDVDHVLDILVSKMSTEQVSNHTHYTGTVNATNIGRQGFTKKGIAVFHFLWFIGIVTVNGKRVCESKANKLSQQSSLPGIASEHRTPELLQTPSYISGSSL